jgi:biotin transporter BioY
VPAPDARRGYLALAAVGLGLAAVDAIGLALLAWLLPPRLPERLAPGGLLRVGFLFPLPWDLAQVCLAAWLVPHVRWQAPWLAFPAKSR